MRNDAIYLLKQKYTMILSEEFKFELFEAAEAKAKKLTFRFSRGAKEDLMNLIKNGVDRMNDTDLKDDIKRNLAHRNLDLLVVAMVENCNERHKTGLLDFISLDFAEEKICPVYPFCATKK